MRLFYLLILGVMLSFGCSPDGRSRPAQQTPSNIPDDSSEEAKEFPLTELDNGEPSHITVQHVLISYKGQLPGKRIMRSKEDAAKLASEVLEKARSGADFDAMVKEYTDDSHPGIYRMANRGQQADQSNRDPAKWIMGRGEMVPAFGDVGFTLEVGEVGMSEFDREKSPFGWHIIKRLK